MKISHILFAALIFNVLTASALNAGGWGTGGVVQTDLGGTETATVVVVQPDGKVLAAGQSDNDMAVVRYNPDGTLDDSFGNDGVAIVQYPLGWSIANDMEVLSDGKILIVGTTHNSSTTDVAIVRLNSDGSLDASFAGGGKIRTDFSAINNYGSYLEVASNGSFYVLDNATYYVNTYNVIENEDSGINLQRYNQDGSLDESWGANGVLVVKSFAANGYKQAIGLSFGVSEDQLVFVARRHVLDEVSKVTINLLSEVVSATQVYWYFNDDWTEFRHGITGSMDRTATGNIGFCYSVGSQESASYGSGHSLASSYLEASGSVLLDSKSVSYVYGKPNAYSELKKCKAFTWMDDGSCFVSLDTAIKKYKNGQLVTTFGIGGNIETSVFSSDFEAYDSSRVIQLSTSSNDFYLAVYNADGSPYINTPPSITSPTTVDGEIQTPLEYIITATNDPTTYSASDLPPGLSLDTSSGTPMVIGTPTQSGTFVATIFATNSGGTGEAQVTFQIAKTSQTISFNNPGAQTLGVLPFPADVVSTSGLPVSVSVTSGPVTIIDNTIYLTGVGLATLTASQSGNSDFAPASDVSLSFSIVLAEETPSILVDPASSSSTAGASAVFSVTVSGPQPYSYQWMKNGSVLEGETNSILVLNSVGYFDEAAYACEVSNSFGSVISANASLNVTADPDALDSDGDGLSDSLEVYLSPFGLDPAVDSTATWNRLRDMVSEQNLGDGFTAEQMRNLALGAPVIQRAENGEFTLQMELLTSENLQTWTVAPLVTDDVGVISGVLNVKLNPSSPDTQFFKIRAKGE